MFKIDKYNSGILKVIKSQIIYGLIFILIISGITKNINNVLSSFIGFYIAFFTTLTYIFIAFNEGFINHPNAVLKKHKKALYLKFIINIILFTLTFIFYKKCNFIMLFFSYLITLSSYWFSLLSKKS